MKIKDYGFKIDSEAMMCIRRACELDNEHIIKSLSKFVKDVEKAKKLAFELMVSVPDSDLVAVVLNVYRGWFPSVKYWLNIIKESSKRDFEFYQQERGDVEGKYATIEPCELKRKRRKK